MSNNGQYYLGGQPLTMSKEMDKWLKNQVKKSRAKKRSEKKERLARCASAQQKGQS